ncbi:MAG: hypothetical protein KJ771_02525 [Nanoarchaeota archaeon]|nr:hypothetical protein [Nanoarchaeota archaeon]
MFLNNLLEKIGIRTQKAISFQLQINDENSRPDALIVLPSKRLFIEAKVRARLDLRQIENHLSTIEPTDQLLVITNHSSDLDKLKNVSAKNIKFLTWGQIYLIALKVKNKIKNDTKLKPVSNLINQYVEYLEVATLTNFNGFRQDDFDFFVNYNKYYLPIIKMKMQTLADEIKSNLPVELNEFKDIKVGNIPKKIPAYYSAWVAIRRKSRHNDSFGQCNFTLQISSDEFQINAVIRNGGINDKKKPLGVLYKNLQDNTAFLDLINKIKKKSEGFDSELIISERRPKTGNKIMPGNERWFPVFSIKLSQISEVSDINYLVQFLSKIKNPYFPGIHLRRRINRGESLLKEKNELIKEIIKTLSSFKKFLDIIEND